MNRGNRAHSQTQDGTLLTFVKGGLVGIANIIPGVSGGTFALILGIFDRLIGSINNLGIETITAAIEFIKCGFRDAGREAFLAEWKRLNGTFLVVLATGAVAAILSSSFLIEYLLKAHYSPTLAFFVGLILPSIAIPWAMMNRRGFLLLWALPGIAITFGVSLVMPDSTVGSDNLLFALVTGAIAISAMILPGLSGSYIMLVMGQYQNALNKLTSLQKGLVQGHFDLEAFLWLAVLAVGMAIGIVLFAKLLNFLLKRFRSATMAFLIGLLVGSLWVLWPFKDIDSGAQIEDRHGEVKEEVKIATAPNRLPKETGEGLIAGGALLGGLICSGSMIAVGRRKKSDS